MAKHNLKTRRLEISAPGSQIVYFDKRLLGGGFIRRTTVQGKPVGGGYYVSAFKEKL